MGNSVARYDAIAEWYPPWVGGDPGLVCEHIASTSPPGLSKWLAHRMLTEMPAPTCGRGGPYGGVVDGVSFDGAVCEMAFMDIDDLAGTLSTTAAALRPGAPFVVSMVNPCFPGNDAGLSSWPPDEGYTAEGFWTSDRHNPEGVRLRVGSNHRMLSTYLNPLIAAGFVLERFHEPPTPVPTWLVIVARRSGSGS